VPFKGNKAFLMQPWLILIRRALQKLETGVTYSLSDFLYGYAIPVPTGAPAMTRAKFLDDI
jgi:hypothetical protein